MISATDRSLLEQCQTLRQQLQEQRGVIAQRLGPASSALPGSYPRSMTMRFLKQQRQGLLIRLVLGSASLLGARYFS
jgi:hypothetical protein